MNPESDPVSFTRFLMASATVIGLMLVLVWGLKQFNQRGLMRMLPGITTNQRRLRHIESLPLDARRRLVIVACDQRQYLLLLGANQDIVVDASLSVPSASVDESVHVPKSSQNS